MCSHSEIRQQNIPLTQYTANGKVYWHHGITAAHRTLPFGSRVRVVHGKRSILVRINGRATAMWTGGCIDLSLGAAGKLEMVKQGVDPVRLWVLQ